MTSVTTQQAATAAKRILGFYNDIPATDRKAFAAGLVQTLSIYRQSVVDRAADPVDGIPGKIKFLNLAAIRECLDDWSAEDHERRALIESKNRPALPAPQENPEMEARVHAGIKGLSARLTRGMGPSSV